ncbi:MAG: sortase-like acyltransferase [Bacteroidetes bacterium]|jgi:L-amino acid N-acyltransferase|nr:sortase-like acyltransferase [Bacteroidota bacterium]
MAESFDVKIRKTAFEDLEAINNILNHAIANTNAYLSSKQKTIKDTEDWFEEHNLPDGYFSLSCEYEGSVIGWACISSFRSIEGFAPTAEVSVYVDLAYRGRGIAGKLMEALIQEAQKRNFHNLISFITVDNETSIFLHQKHGFEVQGTLKEVAIKNGQYQDVVVMAKLLSKLSL